MKAIKLKSKKKTFLVGAASTTLLLAFSLSTLSCSATNEVVAAGSTTLMPFMEFLSEKYRNENKNDKVAILPGGSTVGIQFAQQGLANIGDASRFPKQNEYTDSSWNKMSTITLGYDTFVFGINLKGTGYKVKDGNQLFITPELVAKIYSGTITKWSNALALDPDLNIEQSGTGTDTIKVISREDGSGTKDALYNGLSNWGYNISQLPPSDALIARSNGEVITKNKQTTGSIGYFSYGSMVGISDGDLTIANVEYGTTNSKIEFDKNNLEKAQKDVWTNGISLTTTDKVNRYWFWHPLNVVINSKYEKRSNLSYKFISWIINYEYTNGEFPFADKDSGTYFIPAVYGDTSANKVYLTNYLTNVPSINNINSKWTDLGGFYDWIFTPDKDKQGFSTNWWN